MANPDRPRGFRPVKNLFGVAWNGMARRALMADTSAETENNHGDIYIGDPVTFSSGKLAPAKATNVVAGVCVGVGHVRTDAQNETGMYDVNDLTKQYGDHTLSDTDSIYIYYVPAEGMLFEVQSSQDLAVDNPIGSLFVMTLAGTASHGSRTTNLSSVELEDETANGDCKVVEIPEYPDNDITLTNARYWVQFVDTQLLAENE